MEGGLESSKDDDSAVLPPLGRVVVFKSDPLLTAMLSQTAESIRLEGNPPQCPKHSRLDDWYLRVAYAEQNHPAPVSFFPEVH